MLSFLVAVPALGSLVVTLAGTKRESLASWASLFCAALTLVVALGVAVSFASSSEDAVLWELRAWIPSLGAAYILGIDGLSSVLATWVALLSFVVLLMEPLDRRSTALVLLSEATSLGLFLARDVFLLYAFYGGTVATLALWTRGRRKVLVYQMAGLALVSAFFVRCYQLTFLQTGFVSTELARWRALVPSPDAELTLFSLAFGGVVFVLPLFPAAQWLDGSLEKVPLAGRMLFFGSFSLTGSYLLFRVFLPLCSRGAMAGESWFLGIAFSSLLYAAIAPGRGREGLIVGFQALVVVALLSFHEDGVVGAELLMTSVALGMAGLAIGGSRLLSAFFTSFLLATALVRLMPALQGQTRLWMSALSVALALFVLRFVREVMPILRRPEPGRRGVLLALPLVVCCLSMALAPDAWREHLLPSARDYLGASSHEEPDR